MLLLCMRILRLRPRRLGRKPSPRHVPTTQSELIAMVLDEQIKEPDAAIFDRGLRRPRKPAGKGGKSHPDSTCGNTQDNQIPAVLGPFAASSNELYHRGGQRGSSPKGEGEEQRKSDAAARDRAPSRTHSNRSWPTSWNDLSRWRELLIFFPFLLVFLLTGPGVLPRPH